MVATVDPTQPSKFRTYDMDMPVTPEPLYSTSCRDYKDSTTSTSTIHSERGDDVQEWYDIKARPVVGVRHGLSQVEQKRKRRLRKLAKKARQRNR